MKNKDSDSAESFCFILFWNALLYSTITQRPLRETLLGIIV